MSQSTDDNVSYINMKYMPTRPLVYIHHLLDFVREYAFRCFEYQKKKNLIPFPSMFYILVESKWYWKYQLKSYILKWQHFCTNYKKQQFFSIGVGVTNLSLFYRKNFDFISSWTTTLKISTFFYRKFINIFSNYFSLEKFLFSNLFINC